jgi:hypothetical protein
VIDPSPVLPNITGEFDIWGDDPVHPLPEGYEKGVDLLEKEIEAKATGSKRPASGDSGGQAKKPRTEVPRASWIEGSSLTAKRNDIGGGRGRGGGGGFRGGGFYSGGGGRGFPPRGRGGRGRFFPPHCRY